MLRPSVPDTLCFRVIIYSALWQRGALWDCSCLLNSFARLFSQQIGSLCIYVCLCGGLCTWVQRREKGVRTPVVGVTGDCKTPSMCAGSQTDWHMTCLQQGLRTKTGPVREQQASSSAEPLLQPYLYCFCDSFNIYKVCSDSPFPISLFLFLFFQGWGGLTV